MAVFSLCVFITLVATCFFAYRYVERIETELEAQQDNFAQQVEPLNYALKTNLQTLEGHKEFAQAFLNGKPDLRTATPLLSQQGVNYSSIISEPSELEPHYHEAVITGHGNLAELGQSVLTELSLAQQLGPIFSASTKSNSAAARLYYLSLNRFLVSYEAHDTPQKTYSDKLISDAFMWKVRQGNLQGVPFVWSKALIEEGLNLVKVGAGVFQKGKFRGVLVMDLDLTRLSQLVPAVNSERQGYVLLNEQGSVLFSTHYASEVTPVNRRWSGAVPEQLTSFPLQQLLKRRDYIEYQGWLVRKQPLSVNGWSLVYYQPTSDFAYSIKQRYLTPAVLLVLSLAAFLASVYFMTRRMFVKPASAFIEHIERCADGKPSTAIPTKDWQPWFELVEKVFSENKHLMQQLKLQNAELDSRVVEKTHELMERSEQTERSYLLMRSVINAIPEFIIFNDNEGNLTGCNRSFEHFIGDVEANLVGTPTSQYLPPPIQETLETFYRLPESHTTLGYQQTIETSGNTYEMFCTRFYNESGYALGTIVILRDVTVQFAVQETLTTAKEQAESANKAKSQFLANMSHEIRTPINAIKGMVALMEKTPLSAFQQQYLANAQSSSNTLLHLIDELLDLSKIEVGKLRLNVANANLDSVIDRVIQLNTLAAFKKGIAINIDIDADAPMQLITDEMRLIQVLSNLLNNAVKFTHSGEINLAIKVSGLDRNNALLKFTVKDTGIGIPKDKQDTLFNAFTQVDDSMTRSYGGSGLGLSISQQIVKLMGGEIKVTSTLGKGSEFSFLVPMRLGVQQEVTHEEDVVLIALDCKLPDSLLASVDKFGWQYQQVKDVSALQALVVSGRLVVLVESDTLVNQTVWTTHDIATIRHNVALIGVCHPIATPLDTNLASQLASLSTPYYLFDLPMYRFTLDKIEQQLRANKLQVAQQVHESPPVVNPEKLNTPTPQTALTGSLSGVRVLLAEDNLVNQMVAQELLTAMGADVVVAENGQVALEQLEKVDFDVVLMDIQMPVMDGLTATRKLRANPDYADLPIVAMTAHARADDKEASILAGMNLHIAKPVSAEQLSKSILNVINTTSA